MKAVCTVFLTISCAMVACGITYAASNAGGAEQAGSKQSAAATGTKEPNVTSLLRKKRVEPPVYDKHYGGASRVVANRPKQSDDKHQFHQLFASGNAVDLHDVIAESAARNPKPGFAAHPTIRGAPNAPASAFRRELPTPNDVRHRSPNPAAVSGLAYANTHGDAGINGTRVNRKP